LVSRRAPHAVEAEELVDGAFFFAAGHLFEDVGTKVALDDDAVQAAQGALDGKREVENVHAIAVVFELFPQRFHLTADDSQSA